MKQQLVKLNLQLTSIFHSLQMQQVSMLSSIWYKLQQQTDQLQPFTPIRL